MINSQSWLSSTVGKFWQSVNWENQTIAEVVSGQGISPRLSVKQFFLSIPWSMTSSAPVPAPPPPPTPTDTLDDFLNDVSRFF